MRRSTRRHTAILTSGQLVNWFLAEVSTVAGNHERYADAMDALNVYFEILEPFHRWGDFQMKGRMPRPASLELFIDPYALYGHFRGWLRQRQIDPDAVAVPDVDSLHD